MEIVTRPATPGLYARLSWTAETCRYLVYDGNQDRGAMDPIASCPTAGQALHYADSAELPNSLFVFDRTDKVRVARAESAGAVSLVECS